MKRIMNGHLGESSAKEPAPEISNEQFGESNTPIESKLSTNPL
jgi:hypothetical protein